MKSRSLHKPSKLESIRNWGIALLIVGSLFTPIMAQANEANDTAEEYIIHAGHIGGVLSNCGNYAVREQAFILAYIVGTNANLSKDEIVQILNVAEAEAKARSYSAKQCHTSANAILDAVDASGLDI